MECFCALWQPVLFFLSLYNHLDPLLLFGTWDYEKHFWSEEIYMPTKYHLYSSFIFFFSINHSFHSFLFNLAFPVDPFSAECLMLLRWRLQSFSLLRWIIVVAFDKRNLAELSTTSTLRCQINAPRLLIFGFFSNPADLIRTPRLLILRKLTFYKPLISFPFFVSNIYARFAWQNSVLLCIFKFYALWQPVLFFPSFYNHLKPFLRLQPFVWFDPPVYLVSEFFRSPCLLGPPRLFGTWE